MKTILLAGGTGFLGKVLENFFTKKGDQVKILTRNPKRENEIYWNAKDINESWTSHLENIDVLINLTGKSVDCRYTKKNKALIYNSRIDSTKVLGQAIETCKQPPKIWMNSSTATIYSYSLRKEHSEDSTDFGNDFSMNIAKSWEKAFHETVNAKTRKIILRTSIVFGKDEGAFIPLKKLTQFGLGGKQGNGKQKVSWIHEKDFANAVNFLIEKEDAIGAYNFCAPKPTDNNTLMKTFRKLLKIPFGLPHPKFMLEIGAFFMQTETELILKSRNVIPKKLLDSGFTFQFPTIESALKDLLD